MTTPDSIRWAHRPQDGPVAWGTAVLVAPVVPLLSFFALLLLIAVIPEGWNDLRLVLSPLPWLVVGLLMAGLTSGRVSRGVGVGLLGGALTSLVLAVIASYGGWR